MWRHKRTDLVGGTFLGRGVRLSLRRLPLGPGWRGARWWRFSRWFPGWGVSGAVFGRALTVGLHQTPLGFVGNLCGSDSGVVKYWKWGQQLHFFKYKIHFRCYVNEVTVAKFWICQQPISEIEANDRVSFTMSSLPSTTTWQDPNPEGPRFVTLWCILIQELLYRGKVRHWLLVSSYIHYGHTDIIGYRNANQDVCVCVNIQFHVTDRVPCTKQTYWESSAYWTRL